MKVGSGSFSESPSSLNPSQVVVITYKNHVPLQVFFPPIFSLGKMRMALLYTCTFLFCIFYFFKIFIMILFLKGDYRDVVDVLRITIPTYTPTMFRNMLFGLLHVNLSYNSHESFLQFT